MNTQTEKTLSHSEVNATMFTDESRLESGMKPAGNKTAKRLQAFRKLNPRIDLYPGNEAYRAIVKLKTKFPERNTREIVDMLVIQGIAAFIPERKDGKSILNQQMQRSNPQVATAMASIDEGWANLVRVEAAAKAGKNASGVFTPAQLNAAVQAADSSVRGRSVARGTALMQDLGDAGQSVLGSNVPDSGTVGRLLLGGGALSAGLANPAIPIGLAAGAAAYSKPVQSILNAVLSSRPDIAAPMGNFVSNYATAMANAGTAAALTKAAAQTNPVDGTVKNILGSTSVAGAIKAAQIPDVGAPLPPDQRLVPTSRRIAALPVPAK